MSVDPKAEARTIRLSCLQQAAATNVNITDGNELLRIAERLEAWVWDAAPPPARRGSLRATAVPAAQEGDSQ
jgi:hypothetical protein